MQLFDFKAQVFTIILNCLRTPPDSNWIMQDHISIIYVMMEFKL